MIDGCNTNSLTFKAGGTITDQCAIYSVVPTTRESLTCVSNGGYSAADIAGTNAFDRGAATDAINNFCAQNLLVDPAVTDDTNGWTKMELTLRVSPRAVQSASTSKSLSRGAVNNRTRLQTKPSIRGPAIVRGFYGTPSLIGMTQPRGRIRGEGVLSVR